MKFLLQFVLIFFLASCGKKDIAKNQAISGNVRNNCTGSGFADVTVNLVAKHQKSFGKTETSIISTVTDANGNFGFVTDINKSGKYSYAISIPGYSNYDTELYGTSMEIPIENLNDFQQFGVSATFNNCKITLPAGITVSAPDTFKLTLTQPILHSYEPDRIWIADYYPRYLNSGPLYSPNFNSYPMGWWQITLDKTKGGVHSVVQDSIYLGMGASAVYTIPW